MCLDIFKMLHKHKQVISLCACAWDIQMYAVYIHMLCMYGLMNLWMYMYISMKTWSLRNLKLAVYMYVYIHIHTLVYAYANSLCIVSQLLQLLLLCMYIYTCVCTCMCALSVLFSHCTTILFLVMHVHFISTNMRTYVISKNINIIIQHLYDYVYYNKSLPICA